MDSWTLDRRPVRRILRAQSADVPDGGWPLTVPAVRQLLDRGLELPAGVTFLVGENGSGKSTLVEAVAGAYGLGVEGGTTNSRHTTRATESPLEHWIHLESGVGAPRWGFFLRAESMHGYYTFLDQLHEGRRPSLHDLSHGESFLDLIGRHLREPGLYCLDEPEAALSFGSVLVLLGALAHLQRVGAQVLCATHSPVLAALPGAHLLEVGEWGLREVGYDDLLLVERHRSFLDAPERYLRHVLVDPDEA